MKIDGAYGGHRELALLAPEPVSVPEGAVTRSYAARSLIFDTGGNTSKMIFLKSGWAIASKILPSGTRIVTDFFLCGDMISTMAAELSDETVHALTDVTCCEYSYGASANGVESSSKLSRAVLVELIKRQARMSERLANIGRRDALERTGHLMLELAIRARHITKPNLDGFVCPLKQADIGDAVGLSTVHVNRVLREMRESGLLWFRNGIVEFPDRERLVDYVGFNSSYLSLAGKV